MSFSNFLASPAVWVNYVQHTLNHLYKRVAVDPLIVGLEETSEEECDLDD
jgi:hypothetical protein